MKKVICFMMFLAVIACGKVDNSSFIPGYTDDGMDFSQGAKPIPDSSGNSDREPSVIEDNQIKIMSFNVRTGGADQGTVNAWTERRSGIPAMLYVEAPTLIGLQEAQDYQVEYIVGSLDGYESVGVSRDTGTSTGSGERMSICWNTSVLEMEDWGTFWLSDTPTVPSVGWAGDSQYKRSTTWARFKHIKTGNRFYHVNTHLDLIKSNRENGMALIVSRLKELNSEKYPVLLTGDMNETYPSTVFDPLQDYMFNIREVAKETDRNATSNGFGSGSGIIDHIFFYGFTAKSYRTVTDKWNGIQYISDHYPITGLVEFTNN